MTDWSKLALILAIPLSLALSPVTAHAEDDKKEVDTKKTKKKKDSKKKWRVGARVSTRIGQGILTQTKDNELVGQARGAFQRASLSFGVNGSYNLGKTLPFTIGASIGASQGLLQGNGANRPAEFRLGDMGLSASWKGHTFDDSGIRIGGGGSLSIPTSDFSQAANLVTRLGLSGSVSKKFMDSITLSLGVNASKAFHTTTSATFSPDELQDATIIIREGGAEDLQGRALAIAGVNTEWSVGASLGASLKVVDKLSMSVRYGFSNSWAYDNGSQACDNFTPRENAVCGGRQSRQGASGSIGFSYPFAKHFTASLSFSNGTSPLTRDNKAIAFPFWNFEAPSNNSSGISLGVSGSY